MSKNKNDKLDKTDKSVVNDAKLIIQHALDHNVPVEWYLHRVKGSVFQKTTNLNSDIDFLLNKGEQAEKWYDKNIAEFTRRKKIFGNKKEE
jgi:hypothetical protein